MASVEKGLSSKRESRSAAREVAGHLKELGLKGKTDFTSLTGFFDAVRNSDASAVGLVLRSASKGESLLDVYLRWKDPLDLDSEYQNSQMEVIEEAHLKFAQTAHRHVATFLEYVDPRGHPLPEFGDMIQEWSSQDSQTFHILSLLKIPRNISPAEFSA